MQRYIARRLLLMIPTLIGVTFVVFVMVRDEEGDESPSGGDEAARPLHERAPLIVIRCARLDEEHIAIAERVRIRVGCRQKRRCSKRKCSDSWRDGCRPQPRTQRSTTRARASPPPMQIDAQPRFLFWSFMV